MIKEKRWNIPACMERHLEALDYRNDGCAVLAAGSLTGRCWQGSLWIYSDASLAPSEGFCTAGVQTDAGVTDVKWVSQRAVLLASDSGSVELWELSEDEGPLVNRFSHEEHDDVVTGISVGSGRSHAVSCGVDCRVKVWDLNQEAVISSYHAHSRPVNSVACSPVDESLFMSCGQDGRLLLWDRRKPKPATRLDTVSPACSPTAVVWHPDHSSTIAYGDELGRVTLMELQRSQGVRTGHTHSRRVSRLTFSSDSSPLLASISDDCSVAVVTAELREIFRDRRHRDYVRGACWVPGAASMLTTVGWDHQVLHHTVTPAS